MKNNLTQKIKQLNHITSTGKSVKTLVGLNPLQYLFKITLTHLVFE